MLNINVHLCGLYSNSYWEVNSLTCSICLSLTHLYSKVKACVRPTSHSDILAHGGGAALDWSSKPPQDRCILHLVKHTQCHNAWQEEKWRENRDVTVRTMTGSSAVNTVRSCESQSFLWFDFRAACRFPKRFLLANYWKENHLTLTLCYASKSEGVEEKATDMNKI